MGHPCPSCDRTLSTEQGMRQHHTKVHDEPLPNRECKGCGSSFYDEKARQIYCDNCDPNAGPHNGNWRDAKDTATCDSCGEQFEFYPSDKEGIFCTTCVEKEGTFKGTSYWRRGERIEVTCEYCGENREVLLSAVERGEKRFCNRDCLSSWLSENRRGADHHQWTENEATYTGKWWSVREVALERDGRRCQRCGVVSDTLDRALDVHHIVPVRAFEDPEDAHRLLNVVSLCRGCHRHIEERTIRNGER